MRQVTHNICNIEILLYTLFAVFSVSTVFYLYYYNPVNFSLVVAEDHFAEYATSVCFGLAGIILLALSLLRAKKLRRLIWMLIGVVAIIIAGEEISWGQRIFYVGTPDVLAKYNVQNELTLHNLDVIESSYSHIFLSYLILIYIVFSLMLIFFMPRVKQIFDDVGLPVIQFKLTPIFLLAPSFFIFKPTIYADEIGELFLGIAALMWAVDLGINSSDKKNNRLTSVLIIMGVLSFAAIISWALADRHSSDHSSISERASTLNNMAANTYPELGMYEQSEEVYAYIYLNPKYQKVYTRINHGTLLLKIGKKTEASRVLLIAASEIESKEPTKNSNSRLLRLLGKIYLLLMDESRAEYYFDKSVESDRKNITDFSSGDENAEALWSISKTMRERGDIESAINSIEQAVNYADAPGLRFKLEQILIELNNISKDQCQYC